jgi:hypothetical protein
MPAELIRNPRLHFKEKILEFFWVGILVLSSGIFFQDSFRKGSSFGIWLDNEFSISPMFHNMTDQLNDKGIPSYLPAFLGGVDIQGYPQFNPMYPFYFIGSNLFQTAESSINGLNVLVHIHLLIFALGGYFLLRVLGIDRFSSCLATVFMVFNSNTLNYATWINVLAPYTWLPWILGALFRAIKRGSYGSWSLFYVFCSFLIFASPSQPMIHTFYLVIIVLFSEFLTARKSISTKKYFFNNLGKCISLSPVFLALIAPVLVPAILNIPNQIRWIGNFPAIIGSGKIPFEAFLTSQIEFEEIRHIVLAPTVPREVGGLYLGIFIVALLVYGLFHLRAQRIWRIFFVIGTYSLISAFGKNLGLAYINHEIPLINLIREPSRFLVLAHFSFSICAAFALNDIYKKSFLRFQGYQAFSGLINSGMFKKSLQLSLSLLVISLSVGQSNWVSWKAPDVSMSEYESGNLKDLEKALIKIKQLDPLSTYRVIFGGKLNTQKASMFASFYDLRTLNTYINPLPFNQFNSIYFYNSFPSTYKEILGARFLVCEECTEEELKIYPNYREVWKFGTLKLFENRKAHGYLTVPRNVTYFPKGVSDFRNELELSESPEESVFIEENDLATPRTSRTECTFSEFSQNQFEQFSAKVFCETNGVLVLNSFNDKNWRAKVNGSATTSFSVNGNLVGVNIQAGHNNVEISHEPILRNHLFRYGGIFLAAYLLLFVLLRNKERSISVYIRKLLRS